MSENENVFSINIPPELVTPLYNAEDVELSYKDNRNTGVGYEKGAALDLLNKESVICVFNYTQDDNMYGTRDRT